MKCKVGNSKLKLVTDLQLHQPFAMPECLNVQAMSLLKHTSN